MNWNLLWMYVTTKQLELVDSAAIPSQEKVINYLENGNINADDIARRLFR